MIIAIDGPAASGKGTLGKRIAAHYGFAHLDTGKLYRAVARDVLGAGKKPGDADAAHFDVIGDAWDVEERAEAFLLAALEGAGVDQPGLAFGGDLDELHHRIEGGLADELGVEGDRVARAKLLGEVADLGGGGEDVRMRDHKMIRYGS